MKKSTSWLHPQVYGETVKQRLERLWQLWGVLNGDKSSLAKSPKATQQKARYISEIKYLETIQDDER